MSKKLPLFGMLIAFACGLYFSFFQPTDASTTVTTPSTVKSVNSKQLLPLWDGKISSSPRVWYIYSCWTHVDTSAWWAGKDWPWIIGAMRDPSKKISITWSVMRKEAAFKIVSTWSSRILLWNWLPLWYPTGIFPVGRTDPAHQYDANPNSISKQSVSVTITKYPTVATTPTCIWWGPVWYTLNGVAIFDGLDAAWRDAVAHEVQDECSWHPQQNWQYHYHSMSKCFKDTSKVWQHSSQIWYALDGFGIYGSKDTNGKTVTNADLDECHGHTEKVMWNGKLVTMYHYHATAEYPYTVWCFKWTPAKSWVGQWWQEWWKAITQQQNSQWQQQDKWSAPQEPLNACKGKSAGASCSFVGKWWDTITDTCHSIDVWMVCWGPK